jgi:hypothetical protein
MNNRFLNCLLNVFETKPEEEEEEHSTFVERFESIFKQLRDNSSKDARNLLLILKNSLAAYLSQSNSLAKLETTTTTTTTKYYSDGLRLTIVLICWLQSDERYVDSFFLETLSFLCSKLSSANVNQSLNALIVLSNVFDQLDDVSSSDICQPKPTATTLTIPNNYNWLINPDLKLSMNDLITINDETTIELLAEHVLKLLNNDNRLTRCCATKLATALFRRQIKRFDNSLLKNIVQKDDDDECRMIA